MPPAVASANLIRGLLEPCLLSLLEQGPDYGLSLSQRLEASGIGPVPGGSLYPALLRLDRRGLVTTFWKPSSSGPARKYFELTLLGTTELAARRREWRRLSSALSTVIEGSGQAGRERVPHGPSPSGATVPGGPATPATTGEAVARPTRSSVAHAAPATPEQAAAGHDAEPVSSSSGAPATTAGARP